MTLRKIDIVSSCKCNLIAYRLSSYKSQIGSANEAHCDECVCVRQMQEIVHIVEEIALFPQSIAARDACTHTHTLYNFFCTCCVFLTHSNFTFPHQGDLEPQRYLYLCELKTKLSESIHLVLRCTCKLCILVLNCMHYSHMVPREDWFCSRVVNAWQLKLCKSLFFYFSDSLCCTPVRPPHYTTTLLRPQPC